MKMKNNFFSEVLLSTINNINKESFTKDLLFDKVKEDFNYEIEDFHISPVLEKCIEKGAVKFLESGLFVLTHTGLNLLNSPESAYENLWNIPFAENLEDNIYLKGNPFEKEHVESLNHLYEAYSIYLKDLKRYVKHLLINMNEYKFEELVINILITSGEAPFGEVTKKSNDGGIDGYLYKTRLKQGSMPIQVKRYEDNNLIGVNAIRDFIGAMDQSHRGGSYFISTSTFTYKAIEKAEEHGVILLNGNQLVDLIIEFKVGLMPKHDLEFLMTPTIAKFD
ncbi:hypothetical protein CSV80_17065 [Sporosarcina sp. P12(2017)]|nr:restriction endonuclease [Sporosarcina sp. P12(2017)]PIC55926.1 hypothetical protein CSV81_17055 [Sporosarcina sp. P10]PIC59252.1 hypothetical protein CSV80_17065 [Sporosarcina sp. P12(2017)]